MGLFGSPDTDRLRATGNLVGLGKALENHDDVIKLAAAKALIEAGDPAFPVVAPLLGSPIRMTKILAGRILLGCADSTTWDAAIEALLYSIDSRRPAATDSLAVTVVVQALRSPDSQTRGAAAHILGLWQVWRIDIAECLEPLLELLHDPDMFPRMCAAKAFASFSSETRAIKPLIALLSDPDTAVRIAAAATLGHFRSDQSVRALTALAGVGDAEVRRAAADALRYHRSVYGPSEPASFEE